jgi:electron transport complex protein RnfD
MTEKRFVVSASPHLRQGRTLRSMMLMTIIALVPAALWGVFQFGFRAVYLMEVGIVGAVLAEFLVNKFSGKPSTLGDLHAVLVGFMLALLMPVGAPWYLVFIGAFLAVLIGKMVFGPLGGSPISPVLVGLLIVAASWPVEISNYQHPTTAPDEYHASNVAPPESPLDAVFVDPSDMDDYAAWDLFLGKQVGPIGAISPVLLLIGGLFLILMRVARWQAPVGFLIGLGVAAAMANSSNPELHASAWFQLFSGSAMFGAFFLCTDWSSTPVTPIGMFLFGLIAGGLAVLFRMSGMPYGPVPWAIAVMSLATPILDRIHRNPFGKAARFA